MKFYCIADEDTVRGFRLAGVEGQEVSGPDEAAEAVREEIKAQTGVEVAVIIADTEIMPFGTMLNCRVWAVAVPLME